ncbi:OmpA family protein [Aquabacterium sp. A7-Y]|uniref:OmpA family protein n=1 Tax=Aquabacterium sp. A7-Y TaxID=1349605 RepID=UPI00223E3EF0|nr:OmpA family protein [Aquabacterium sp. A7-Y]MCW7539590.1 OmpA family protein [Aquabacterium sp. A7-Y]
MNAYPRRAAALCVLSLLALAAGCATQPAPAPETPPATSAPAAPAAPAAPGWTPALAAVFEAAQRAAQGSGVAVSRTGEQELLLRATGDAAFDSGRTGINARFRKFLDTLAEPLARAPGLQVRVVGHTDNVGSNAVNDRISLERANSARDYLVTHGVTADRISAEGRGEREPVAGNESAEGRAANRRVELIISPAATR